MTIRDYPAEGDRREASVFSPNPEMGVKVKTYGTAGITEIKELFASGKISARGKLILQFLFELGDMTSKQIQMAFSHPMVDKALLKVCCDGKNPYANEIRRLEEYGLLKVSRLLIREKETLKIYGITNAAQTVLTGKYKNGRRYFELEREIPVRSASNTGLREVGRLSAVTYHIREVCGSYDIFKHYTTSYIEGVSVFDGYYRYKDGTELLIMAIRDPAKEHQKAIAALGCSLLKNSQAHLLFLLPNHENPFQLREYLIGKPGYSDGKILYSTDFLVKVSVGSPLIYQLSDKGEHILATE